MFHNNMEFFTADPSYWECILQANEISFSALMFLPYTNDLFDGSLSRWGRNEVGWIFTPAEIHCITSL